MEMVDDEKVSEGCRASSEYLRNNTVESGEAEIFN